MLAELRIQPFFSVFNSAIRPISPGGEFAANEFKCAFQKSIRFRAMCDLPTPRRCVWKFVRHSESLFPQIKEGFVGVANGC